MAPTVTVSAASDTVTLHSSVGAAQLSTPYYATTETIYIKATDGTTTGGNKSIIVSSPDSGSDITVLLNDDGASIEAGTGSDPVADDGVYWGALTISDTSTSDSNQQILVNEGNDATINVDLDGAGDGTSATVTADYTAPSIDSVETVQAGARPENDVNKVEIAFTDTGSGLDADSVAPSDFAVDTGSGLTQISGGGDDSVSVSGNTVTLSFDDSEGNISNFDTGGTPDVSVTSDGNGVDDVAGNTLSSTAQVTALDKLSPVVTSADAYDTDNDGYLNEVELTLSEDVASNSPSTSAFSVTDANGDTLNVDGVTAQDPSTDQVTVTLSDDLGTTGAPTLSYSSGYTVEIQDDAATPNVLASVSPTVNDGAGPVLKDVTYSASSAPRSPETLELEFSETIALVGQPDVDYTVYYDTDGDGTYDDREVTPQDVTNEDGDNVVDMTIPNQSLFTSPGNKFEVEVSNNDTDPEVQDANEVEAVDPTSGTTADVSDFAPGPPEIVSVTDAKTETTDQTTIQVSFGEALVNDTVDAGDFEVSTGQSVDTIGGETDDDGQITLNLGSNMATDATPDISILSAGSVSDYAGNTQSDYTFTGTEDGVSPNMDSATTESLTSIDVTFSEDLNADTVTASDFNVSGAISGNPGEVSVSGGVVTLSLDSEIANTGATPSVELVNGESVSDTSGNSITGSPTSPTDGVSDGVAPVLQTITWNDNQNSGTGADVVSEEDTLNITFSEDMDVATPTITSSNINTVLGADFGTGPTVDWSANGGDDGLQVTLASGENISQGDSITPTTAVKDDSDNGAASVSAAVENSADPVLYDGTYYADIEAALSEASAGDVIKVTDAYSGNDSFPILVDIPVTIQAAAGATPVVDADGATNGPVFNITASGSDATVTISGLEIVTADDENDVTDQDAIYNGTTGEVDLVITGNTFKITDTANDTYSDNNTGVRIANPNADFTIENNVFTVADDASNTLGTDTTGFDKEITTTEGYSSGITLYNTDADNQDVIKGNEFKYLTNGMTTGSAGTFNLLVENNTFSYIPGTEAFWLVNDNSGNSSYKIVKNDFKYMPQGIGLADGVDVPGTVENNNFMNADLENGKPDDGGDYGGYAIDSGNNSLDAVRNYWNDAAGPGNDGSNRAISDGEHVNTNVSYSPWLDAAYPDGVAVSETTVSYTPSTAGFHLMSIDAVPIDPTPTDLFGSTATGIFYWDGTSYLQSDDLGEIEPQLGYWLYAMESEATNNVVSSDHNSALTVGGNVEEDLLGAGWHMISSPFPVTLGDIKVYWDGNEYTGLGSAPDSVISPEVFAYVDGTDADDKPDHYESVSDSAARLNPQRGYFVNTGEAEVTLELPYSPAAPPSPSSSAMSLDAQGFEPVPEGEETPPAPPAAPQAAGKLEATAAVTAEGVTFEVAGTDVDGINVQVFDPNGGEVFSGSANGNSLSWNAEVANGVYLYGASAEVDGETKPLGIQKLLILQ